MNDIIHLLPDAVANQIAAGEVVQRPASAVKELMENAVDAGATLIQLIIKDAGRTLIQVIDNGKGMSFSDARMCFERHATSKIEKADDLFHITTKGFRGEALASIAAIAHVELKTKRPDDEMGTLVCNEGSEIKEHAPTITQDGTSISVKNLFFNVPARRNFLKTDAIEFSHIEEEFIRVALIHTDVAFVLLHNGKKIYDLAASNFKQRIINIFGNHFKDKLFPVEQNTDFGILSGFIAKPENAKKKKSEQYMFINNRFVRHNLLNYAIETAYKELIPDGYRPAYFIHLELDPTTIDINISPTKIDVKLQDEKLIFGFLNAAVKKSLGTMSLTPQLDFEYERGLDVSNFPQKQNITPPTVTLNPHYNPFQTEKNSSYGNGNYEHSTPQKSQLEGWNNFLSNLQTETVNIPSRLNQTEEELISTDTEEESTSEIMEVPTHFFAIDKRHIATEICGKLALISIVNARERILFQQYSEALENQPITIQQCLFPETLSFSTANAELLNELLPDLKKLGYDIEPMGGNQFAINGTPLNSEEEDLQNTMEEMLSSYKSNIFLYRAEKNSNLALSLAKKKASLFKPFTADCEIADFLNQLLHCGVNNISPSGKKIIHYISSIELSNLFEN